MKRALILAIILLAAGSSVATVIEVPGDYSNIQAAINFSSNGDTVLVHPGTYYQNIGFNGHNVVLGSQYLTTGNAEFIALTIIDGAGAGSVLTLTSGETGAAKIIGFTIRNGDNIRGGGIYCDGSQPEIRNNVITGNTAHPDINWNGLGGGLYCHQSDITLKNNVICFNEAYYDGGGIYTYDSDAAFMNNIFWGNSAMYGGAVSGGASSMLQITNSIFWANSAIDLGDELYFSDAILPIITYCDIAGETWPGDGNISIDPLLRDPANGDFHLMAVACGDPQDSPCIDAGEPAVQDTYIDCNWGLGNTRSDIGAFGGVTIDNPIPTLSEWGLLILALLILAGGMSAIICRGRAGQPE